MALFMLASQAGAATHDLQSEASTTVVIKAPEGSKDCRPGTEQINSVTGRKQVCR